MSKQSRVTTHRPLTICAVLFCCCLMAVTPRTALALPPDAHRAYFLTALQGRIPATDSAAAATALSSGIKTDAGNINWAPGDPENGALEIISERLRREYGLAVGLISTVPFNHATPAGFAAHNRNRSHYDEIAHEIIWDTVPEIVVGGGYDSGYFPISSSDHDALVAGSTDYTHVVMRQTGISGAASLAESAADVRLEAGDRLFALFGTSGGNWSYHDVANAPGQPAVTPGAIEDPTLRDAVSSVLPVLAQDADGFFALVEQGDIDWSNHANDYAHMIGGVWDLDRAVAEAIYLVDSAADIHWDDTLLIVTSDHANSYLRILKQQALVAGNLPSQERDDAGWTYPDKEVSYATRGHTNELVTVWARGQGAELFAQATPAYPGTRILDNTQIPNLIWRAVSELGARHIVLFIGDGMHVEHEIAGSLYLYGEPLALSWHDWPSYTDGWAGYCTTWDVTTYNRYASAWGAHPYDPDDLDPAIGYDPAQGGCAPFPLSCANNLPVLYSDYAVALPLAASVP